MSGDILTAAAFAGHFAACAAAFPVVQEVPYARALAIAHHESGLDRLIVGVNADTSRGLPHQTLRPRDDAEAVRMLSAVLADGRKPDAGVMQVTVADWSAYGLTVETVFDARANICAGLRILGEAYRAESSRVACRYNAGRPDCPVRYPNAITAQMVRRAASVLPVAAPAPANPIQARPPVPHQRQPFDLFERAAQRRQHVSQPAAEGIEAALAEPDIIASLENGE
jgi:hypothetical protein